MLYLMLVLQRVDDRIEDGCHGHEQPVAEQQAGTEHTLATVIVHQPEDRQRCHDVQNRRDQAGKRLLIIR